MRVIKKILILVVIILLGVILSSCIAADPIGDKDNDKKLYTGIKLDNLELINEALEDGANINKIEGMMLSESNPVRIALNDNKDRIAEYLIKRGADANYTDNSGISLLMFKAYNTDINFCDLLLKHGAKIDKTDKAGDTALEYAVRGRSKRSTENEINQIITKLVDNGAKIRPNTLDALLKGNGTYDNSCMYEIARRILADLNKSGNRTELDPALEAAILGESSKVEELIKDNKIKKEFEQQLLFYTAGFGSVETIKLLDDKGLDLKSYDKLKNTLLITASQYGNIEMVKYLLDKGLDIEAQNKDGYTALLAAVRNNQYNVAEYLIKKGAKPHLENGYSVQDALCEAAGNGNINMIKLIISNGYTISSETIGLAMGSAARKNKVEVLKYFLDMGADISIQYNGSNLFKESGSLDVYKFLIDHGAEIDGINTAGEPLKANSGDGNTEVVEYLLKKGANVNAVSISVDGKKDGLKSDSALMKAIVRGNFDIVKLLVENGADLEYQNEQVDKNTAIIIAASSGSRNIVEYLIKKGAKINYQNQKGQTALMYSVSNGWIDNVKILMEYKADISLRDKDGHTALDIAKEKKNKAIIEILGSAK